MAEIEGSPDPQLTRESVTNQAGTHRAVVLSKPMATAREVCQDRILVEDLAVGSTQ